MCTKDCVSLCYWLYFQQMLFCLVLLMFVVLFLYFDRTGRTRRAPAPDSLLDPTWALIGLVSGSMLTLLLLFML